MSILLFWLPVVHNSLLVAFSAWTFYHMSATLLREGIVFQHEYYFQHADFASLVHLFYLSKYYEFGDTALLLLQGKTPRFLQVYHHVGAVVSWYLMYTYRVDMVWMPTLLNSFVHTLMYSYYLASLLRVPGLKRWKRTLTTLQLCQFAALYSNFYFYSPPVETWFNYSIICFFAGYGVGIVALFSQFYYESYVARGAGFRTTDI